MSLLVALTLLVILITTIVIYLKYKFSYWKRRGVPFIEPSIPFGNYGPLFRFAQSISQNTHNLYNRLDEPVVGTYIGLRPGLLIRDPKILRDILIKDFSSFWHRGFHFDMDNDPLAGNLFSRSGEKWREMRNNLSPAFTSGKLKGMVDTIVECSKPLEEYMCANSGTEIEVHDLFSRFTTNVIASVGFGLEVDCIKDPDNEFRKYGKIFFEPFRRNAMRFHLSYVSPFLTKLFKVRFVDKQVEEFLTEAVLQNMKYREENNIIRKDFFQLLLQLKNSGKVQDDDGDWSTKQTEGGTSITVNEMTAEAFIFFVAGYDSASTTMSFCMYEFAQNLEIQQKAFEDVNNALSLFDGKITYESLNEMKYLDNCIDETLRKHPPFGFSSRECTKDYRIADTNIVIEKGTPILISVVGFQSDPKYFDQPNEFRPERFSKIENSYKNRLDTPYLVFGDGPRNCIGMRMGKIVSKIGVCLLLRKFSVGLGAQHLTDEINFSPDTPIRLPINGIHLKLKAR